MSIIHHGFDESPDQFEGRKAWPIKDTKDWKGEFASQSPLNQMHVSHDDGAEGRRGYLALVGDHSDVFYAEATPRWCRPRQAFDLRNTRATMYLKEISPLTVAPGYRPHLFIAHYEERDSSYCGWFVREPLRIGRGEWTLNQVDLLNDERLWRRYSNSRALDLVLGNVGFIGLMYFDAGMNVRGVDACGVLGLDEFRFNIPLPRAASVA